MISIFLVLVLTGVFYICYHYVNHLLSALLKRLLSCQRVQLQDISFRGVGLVKLSYEGYDVQLQSVRFWSNFFSAEGKLFHLLIGDVRVEKRSKSAVSAQLSTENADGTKDQPTDDPNSSQTPSTKSAKRLTKIMNYLQYVNLRVGTALIVLLDDVPDCLLHITIEGLNLETFRDREGLQLELQFRLIQAKLFMRNPLPSKGTSLMDIQLTGRTSMDVVSETGRIKKLGLHLKNPKICVSDVLFEYLLSHSPATRSSASTSKESSRKSKRSKLIRFVEATPSLDIDLDSFVVEYIAFLSAASSRTLSLSLQKIKADFNAVERVGVAKFGDLNIGDHRAASSFKCIQFMAGLNRQKQKSEFDESELNDKTQKFDVEVRLGKPQLELYKQDLEWWMDYLRLLPAQQLAQAFRSNNTKTTDVPDDIQTVKEESPIVHLHLELNGFQCLLRVREGPIIVVGIETAGLKCDHQFRTIEFEVESLWCHRGSGGLLSQLSFDQHCWGTTVAVGAACLQLIRPKDNQLKIYIQVDDCQFEWEASVMAHLVEYIRLFRKPNAPMPPKTDSVVHSQPNLELYAEQKEVESSSETSPVELQVMLSAKKLSLFFTAKGAAFVACSIETLRVDWLERKAARRINLNFEQIRLGTGELDIRHSLPIQWWKRDAPKRLVINESGGCARLAVKLDLDTTKRRLSVEAGDSLSLCWSTLGYAVCFEVQSHTKALLASLERAPALSDQTTPSFLEIFIRSENPVELEIQLPAEHVMRWIVPSLHFERSEAHILISAPTFLLELDSHILMTLDMPCFERQEMSALMDMARSDFKKRLNRTNRVWLWSAQTMELIFPYKYDFAAAFDQILNAFKWVKQLHGVQRKPFTLDSPLPSDLNIVIKEALLCMNDDPFENQLQLIYEISMDEVFERERRCQMLDQKIDQLKREDNGGLSKAKLDALQQSLAKKDAQIYAERIMKAKKQQQRHLLSWRLKNFDLKAFADLSLHGKENALRCIRSYNPEAPLPQEMEFSTLWARDIVLDVAESRMQFRDYPLPYQHLKDAHFWGTICGAEQLAGQRSMREAFVELPEPWGTFIIQRNMCPLKFYYDLECEAADLSITYGPCWEPCLSMVSLCWRFINSPSRDPSPPLAFWDKIRLLLHGRILVSARKLVTSMLASPDPYNDTELIEIAWEQFAFEWLTGEFRIYTDLDAFIRTASKYDDSRLLHLPQLKLFIQLNWACLNDQHDHHTVHPIAPNKLPDYVTNGGHDSYRGFRSEHLDLVLQVEVKPHHYRDTECPQILFYANTFKWLDFLKNTLTMVNRPIKRGKIFNEVGHRRQQLSRHFKNIQLNLMLPRFLISYWMSFSSSFGFRMCSESLRLTSSMVLHTTSGVTASLDDRSSQPSDATLLRRSRTAWKISHISVQLENAQVHLFGETRQPNQTGFNDNDESFFIGLSRLNYVRESKANKLTVIPKHKRTQSNAAKVNNSSRAGPDLNSSGVNQTTKDAPAVHRLTVHDLRASWTTENRDTCLAIVDGIQKAYLLRKVLSNDAMKMFQFVDLDTQESLAMKNRAAFAERFDLRRGSKNSPTNSPETTEKPEASETLETVDDSEHMLWRLINEAETNLVAYSEETVEPPTNSLLGVALCTTDDIVLTNWQVDLLNSQVVLKGHETDGFILVSAARASITQRYHLPVWKEAQLLLKRSFTSLLSGMQYFAPLTIGPQIPIPTAGDNEEAPTATRYRAFQWLNREIIEEKDPSGPNDKLNNYLSSGDAVGGVVTTTMPNNRSSPRSSSSSLSSSSISLDQQPQSRSFQLQRVASRCSCQLFFCYYSDLINMEKFEDIMVIGAVPNTPSATSADKQSPYASTREDVDCFTLKHNMLEVCTNAEQYQTFLDIVNNLVLFVDSKKKMAQERRRRLWFELANKEKTTVKSMVQVQQKDLRELVAIIRSLERQAYFLNKQIQACPNDPELNSANDSLQVEIEENKKRQLALIDELAQTISVFKEKTVDEQIEQHRRRDEHEDQQHEEDRDNVVEIARRFEVCFEDCMWRLTEQDGQISITEVQIRNFLYNRTARIDNSGEHLLEIGTVKVLNLLPNSKYRETLSRLPKADATNETDKTPSIRVICRERAPVGGISLKEHFEVNIAPMQAQITYRFFEKMMTFFFPNRSTEESAQTSQSLSVEPAAGQSDESSQRSLWLSKKFRGAAYNSFRSSKPVQPSEKSSTAHTTEDEIDRMKQRADKNNMFTYINITSVPFIVSYKGNKDKNIEDVDRIDLTLPQFESHDKNWTWLDLSLEIKRLYRNALLSQFMKQKILRKTIHERAHSPAANEEEKKRIVLGTPLPPSSTSKKKKK